MSELHIPIQPPVLDEASTTTAREFFNSPLGQKIFQLMYRNRPQVTARKYDERRTQLEKRLGYEECLDMLILTLRPKQNS